MRNKTWGILHAVLKNERHMHIMDLSTKNSLYLNFKYAPAIQLLWRPNLGMLLGSVPAGDNGLSIGDWNVWPPVVQHKERLLTKYRDLTKT